MNILHVITTMNPKAGGVCQAVRTMIVGLNDLGVKNEVVSLDITTDVFFNEKSFIIYAIGPAKGPWAYSKLLYPWLIKNLANYDSVIVHGLWLYPSYATAKALKAIIDKANFKISFPKLFIMPHGMLDPYFQKASNRKLKALRNKIYWKLIESKVINNAEALLFTCKEELILARQPFKPYKPKKELVVGLGVDEPPKFKPNMKALFLQKNPHLNNSNYLLFIGRINEKKGVDLLVEAYINLFTNYIKLRDFPGIKLVIAGPGLETVYGKQLQNVIKQIPDLGNYILFPGMLLDDAKWGAFYGCDAFILPSHQENFGIAVVEALACNKPVLISNKINIWREIDDSNAGIIKDDSLIGTIDLLNSWNSISIDKKYLMCQNANQCYKNKFAIIPAANKLLNVLK